MANKTIGDSKRPIPTLEDFKRMKDILDQQNGRKIRDDDMRIMDLKKKITLNYSLIGAINSGVKVHPMEDLRFRGCNILKYEGVPIADCCIIEVDRLPSQIPNYITLVNELEENKYRQE